MRWLIDAQLPARIAAWLRGQGHYAKHTLELPNGNRTTDADIIRHAVDERLIVVTKDSDFVRQFLLNGQPPLLLVSTGNLGNSELQWLLENNLAAIEFAFENARFVELNRSSLIVHE